MCSRHEQLPHVALELERSGRRPTSDRRRQSSARYAGAAPTTSDWCTSPAILNTTRVSLYTVDVCVCVDCSFLSLTWRPWCLAWKRMWPVSRDWMNSRRVERPRWVSTSSVTCWATSVHNSAYSKSSGTSRGWEGNRGPAVESHVEQHMSTTQPTASHQVRHEAG